MAEASVHTAVDARGVATVTLANAAKLNTLHPALMRDFVAAVEGLAAIPALRAVVLRGEGERAFIGGADITAMAGLDAAGARAFITLVHRCCAVLRACPVPVIARLAGWTLGAGLEVAAAADLRIAESAARFGMPEVRIGIPSVVEAALLPGLIGWGRARRLLLTGETIDAATAGAWGLVEEVVAHDALDTAVERVLEGILASGPRAVRLQKELIAAWEDLPPAAAVRRGIDAFAQAWESEEPRRMMGQFLGRMRRRKTTPASE
ncbi:MAG: enoyl-CoA hydratase/isomerase family protein [Rhodospirillales bacterium]|nr:enoyl-CoA hydratase/isomerase family protein [Rhodospirillales bacterium]